MMENFIKLENYWKKQKPLKKNTKKPISFNLIMPKALKPPKRRKKSKLISSYELYKQKHF